MVHILPMGTPAISGNRNGSRSDLYAQPKNEDHSLMFTFHSGLVPSSNVFTIQEPHTEHIVTKQDSGELTFQTPISSPISTRF